MVIPRALSLVVVALSMAVPTAHGQVVTIPNLSARLQIAPSGGPQYLEDPTLAAPIAISGSAFGSGISQGHGEAQVDWGVIRLHGTATSASTSATGIFRDYLTITSPLVADGTAAVLSFALLIDGAFHVTGVGNAGWRASAHLGGGTNDQINAGGTTFESSYFGDALGVYSGQSTFVFGQPLRAIVSLTGSVVGTGLFDLGHSLRWGGIQGILVNGVAIDDFQVSSASGADYRHAIAAVPEPAGVMLLAAGLAVLGWRRRAGGAARRALPA